MCSCLSRDMRVVRHQLDRFELKKLLKFREQNGEFWAPVPGSGRARAVSGTVYIARCCRSRYKVLGILVTTPRDPLVVHPG